MDFMTMLYIVLAIYVLLLILPESKSKRRKRFNNRMHWPVILGGSQKIEMLNSRGETYLIDRRLRALNRRVLRRYGWRCMKCGTRKAMMHVDHIKPKSKYPELALEFDNLQVLCSGCNRVKSNREETDYRKWWLR